jgi:hypothetical protein
MARSLLDLFRESPFLMVLATLGGVFAAILRRRRAGLRRLGGVRLGVRPGAALQRCVTSRAGAAYCFFAASRCSRGGKRPGARRRGWRRSLAIYVAFNLGYLLMNAVANPHARSRASGWALEHASDRRILAADYRTDLPNRAYAHYYLGDDMAQLAVSIDRYAIDYVIADVYEWSPTLRSELAARYEKVHEWPFGQVYRVGPQQPPGALRARRRAIMTARRRPRGRLGCPRFRW